MTTFKKSHPIKDKDARSAWSMQFDQCMICGIDRWQAIGVRFPCLLQVHHIMKQGRSDENSNLLLVCSQCHAVIEGERLPDGPGHWPELSLAHVLWSKRLHDNKHYDPERLCELWHRPLSALPEPESLPERYALERLRWRSR